VQLLPALVAEFGEERGDAEIRTVADALLAQFQDAPIRSFALPLAERKARDRLRATAGAAR